MRKFTVLTVAVLALFALIVAPATSFAGSCGGKNKTTDAKQASAQCSKQEAAACAAKLGLTVEECQKLCAVEGHSLVSLSIEGMTCVGCENTITACLEGIPGVMKVGAVSHKDGTAFVVIDTKEVKDEVLAKAVTKKGYKAEVVPAVARTDAAESKLVSGKAGCSAAAHKACSKTCAKTCGAKAKTEAKTEKTDDTEGTL